MNRRVMGIGLVGLLACGGCMAEYKRAIRNYAESNVTSALTIQTLIETVKCDQPDAAKAKECTDAVDKIKQVVKTLEKDSQDVKAKAQ